MAQGIENVVVDSSSIRVSRRRQAKTDRLDAEALVQMLVRHVAGERKVWSVVHVPSPEAEDRRQRGRELETLKADRTRLRNRIQGLLATQGVALALTRDFVAQVPAARTGDGRALGAELQARLIREWAALQALETRIATLEAERRAALRTGTDVASRQARALSKLRAVGEVGATTLSAELFSWRAFQNGRQVGAVVGLVPTPTGVTSRCRSRGSVARGAANYAR